MSDTSLGEPYARYAAVARLMMDTFSMKCLDATFSTYLRDMTNASWDGPAAGGGGYGHVLGSGVFVCVNIVILAFENVTITVEKQLFLCTVYLWVVRWCVFVLMTENYWHRQCDVTLKFSTVILNTWAINCSRGGNTRLSIISSVRRPEHNTDPGQLSCWVWDVVTAVMLQTHFWVLWKGFF